MGCALPLAMGVKQAAPDRPVIAFTGDAGLEMVMGELATARDMKLAIVIVVFVDESLALIEIKQRNSELVNQGVDFGGTDFTALAEAMGGSGVTVRDRAALASAVREGLAADSFTIISAVIDRQAYDDRL